MHSKRDIRYVSKIESSKMLNDKEPYHEIVDETKASTATISRANKSLIYRAEGYHLIFNNTK